MRTNSPSGGSMTTSAVMRRTVPLQAQFWGKVDVRTAGFCWPWKGSTTGPMGYGTLRFSYEGRWISRGAHRIAWYLINGSWPTEHLDHLCSNPRCVNPFHLEEVTQAENMRRMSERGRSSNQQKILCPQGHPYDRMKSRGDGTHFRACSICSLASTHRRRGTEKSIHTGPRRKRVNV